MNFIFNLFKKNKNEKIKNSSIYDTDISNIDPIERSIIFYEAHLKNIGEIDFKNITFTKQRELSPEELSFLKYLKNKRLNNIAGYWTHQINLNINKTIKDFLSMNLIEFLIIPENLTIPEIKNILTSKNLSKKGKKSELINTIKEHFSKDEIDSFEIYNNKRKFILTDVGKKLIENLPPAITHNHIFDKKCLDNLVQKNFSTAYKDICLYESNKPAKRGIGIDWQEEYISMSNNNSSRYNMINFEKYNNLFEHKFLDNELSNNLYIALIIYFDMLGKSDFTDNILEFYIPNYYNETCEQLIKDACLNSEQKYKEQKYKDFKFDDSILNKAFINSRYANYYYRVGKIDKSIDYFEKAILYNSELYDNYTNLIEIYNKYNFENSLKRIEDRFKLLKIYKKDLN